MTARSRLADRRVCLTYDFEHAGIVYTATAGFYGHGRLGELFLGCKHLVSSGADATANEIGYLASLALQHGCSLETIATALPHDNEGKPASILGVAIARLGTDPWSEVQRVMVRTEPEEGADIVVVRTDPAPTEAAQ